jgi:uncharacterized membrane protein YeaQ/YmgE (transglycosylase-associated protein family)
MLLNVVVGLAGATLGRWFLSRFVGMSTSNQRNFGAASFVVSFLGGAHRH